MPLRGRTTLHNPALFFATTTTLKWEKWFDTNDKLRDLETILFDTVRIKQCALMGYVLMPNHVHLLLGCPDAGPGLSKFMHSFKIISAKVFSTAGGIWQSRFDDLMMTSEEQFRTKLNYIHDNPVRAELVADQTGWEYSSARFWLLDKPSKHLTKSFSWLDWASPAKNGRVWAPDRTA